MFAASNRRITAKGGEINGIEGALCPEPWNAEDRNAVAVMVGTFHIGYLPRDLAPDYSPSLIKLAQAGMVLSVTVRIWARLDNGMARARATVLAPEAEEIRRKVG